MCARCLLRHVPGSVSTTNGFHAAPADVLTKKGVAGSPINELTLQSFRGRPIAPPAGPQFDVAGPLLSPLFTRFKFKGRDTAAARRPARDAAIYAHSCGFGNSPNTIISRVFSKPFSAVFPVFAQDRRETPRPCLLDLSAPIEEILVQLAR